MYAIVTGGAGFLGRAVVARLLAEGSEVLAIDDESTPGSSLAELAGGDLSRCMTIRSDMTRSAFRKKLERSPDEIWHLASPASPALYKTRQRTTLRLGGAVLDSLLGWAHAAGNAGAPCRVLFASSSEVYGNPPRDQHPQRETYAGNVSSVGPRSMYDEAKRYGEALCMAWHREAGVDVRIPRIHNTYGPGMHPGDGRVVSSLVHAALTGGVFRMHGDGSQTRSLSYLDDTVDGLFRVMRATDPVLTCRPVNVGGDHEVTIRELANLVASIVGRFSVEFAPKQDQDDPVRRRPDLTLLRMFGWFPKVDLPTGIQLTAEWMSKHAM